MNAKTRTARRAGRLLTTATVLGAALLTSACANGKQAETAQEKPTLDGTNADVGNISLRGLVVATPPSGGKYSQGDSASLEVVIANHSGRIDTLTGVTSPAFSSWGTFASSEAANAFIAGQQRGAGGSSSSSSSSAPGPSAVPSSAPASSPSASSSSTSSTSSSAPSTTAPLPLGQQKVRVAPGTSVSFGKPVSPAVLLLENLTKSALYPAENVVLTFTFAKAGSVTVRVPVELSAHGGSESVPAESSSPSSGTGG